MQTGQGLRFKDLKITTLYHLIFFLVLQGILNTHISQQYCGPTALRLAIFIGY